MRAIGLARMGDPIITRPRGMACARCGGPFGEGPEMAVRTRPQNPRAGFLCVACVTALQLAFEQRCRWDSLAADDLAREAHRQRLGIADTHESRDYDALPPQDRSRYDAAAAVCLCSLDPEWRRVALDRAAERLVEIIVEAAPVLALSADASDVTRATKVRHLANEILNVYHQTLADCGRCRRVRVCSLSGGRKRPWRRARSVSRGWTSIAWSFVRAGGSATTARGRGSDDDLD